MGLESYYNGTTVHSSKKITEAANYFENIVVLHLDEKTIATASAAASFAN